LSNLNLTIKFKFDKIKYFISKRQHTEYTTKYINTIHNPDNLYWTNRQNIYLFLFNYPNYPSLLKQYITTFVHKQCNRYREYYAYLKCSSIFLSHLSVLYSCQIEYGKSFCEQWIHPYLIKKIKKYNTLHSNKIKNKIKQSLWNITNKFKSLISSNLSNKIQLNEIQQNEFSLLHEYKHVIPPLPGYWAGVNLEPCCKHSKNNILSLEFEGGKYIPLEIGLFEKLEILKIRSVGQNIPFTIGNLHNLRILSIQNVVNKLTGSIPNSLYHLKNLTDLKIEGYCNYSHLSGSLSPKIGNLLNLLHLNISNHLLTGSIPNELGNLVSLKTINLSKNQLVGPIPNSFQQLTCLEKLDLHDNQLSGQIQWIEVFSKINHLSYLNLRQNKLKNDIHKMSIVQQQKQFMTICV